MSWSSQARQPGGMFHPEKACPQVDDCDIRNFLLGARAPRKAVRKAPSWPHKGKWDPAKDKGKGRGK